MYVVLKKYFNILCRSDVNNKHYVGITKVKTAVVTCVDRVRTLRY